MKENSCTDMLLQCTLSMFLLSPLFIVVLDIRKYCELWVASSSKFCSIADMQKCTDRSQKKSSRQLTDFTLGLTLKLKYALRVFCVSVSADTGSGQIFSTTSLITRTLCH